MMQSVENIASVSEENSAAVEEVSASAEEISAQVEEVLLQPNRWKRCRWRSNSRPTGLKFSSTLHLKK